MAADIDVFGIVMGMSILVYLYLAPRIRKGLEQ